jgi:hypothetical protein
MAPNQAFKKFAALNKRHGEGIAANCTLRSKVMLGLVKKST